MSEGVHRANARGRSNLRYPALGALALGFYLVHAAGHALNGHIEDAFWACHLGAVLVAVGLMIGRRLPCAVGFLWLCVGDVFWGLDLATGGELIPTSILTHVGALLVGGVGVARIGMPRHAAICAIAGFLALQLLSRLLTDPATNLNLAHAVWPGWEATFPSYRAYQALLLSIGFASFLAVERLARLWLARSATSVARRCAEG
jgi:hypothetical protein